VLIKQVEYEIAEWTAGQGFVPVMPSPSTGKRVAVVGSGPAGLAAAQQLTRAGHGVVVFERAERIGGLLRYGVPEFKMEKSFIDRRLLQMAAEGTEFRTGVAVGLGARDEVPGSAAPDAAVVSATELCRDFDAIVLAIGSTRPRDLVVKGRKLRGVHFGMEYLKAANLVCEGTAPFTPISASGKHVIILGGGDTGADCLGTVHRQGAASVSQLEILPEPPAHRLENNPWPTWPVTLRSSAAHEEGGDRLYSIATSELVDDGTGAVGVLRANRVERVVSAGETQFRPIAGAQVELAADLVLLALGFVGPELNGPVAELGCARSDRGTLLIDASYMTSVPGVFACGDAARGQSLIVWAIAEGRSAAAAVDRHLMGASDLPFPLAVGAVGLS
jgi:glutamate synthase (NADPH/NADH) small chain